MTPAEDNDDAQADSRATQLALTAGMALATARTALGRSIEEIAAETRVPLRHLRALEADRHDELPALPYAQGFVRSFARAVKLDPDMLAAQFKAETSKQPHVPSASPVAPLDARRLPSRGVVLASLAALVLVVLGVSAWSGGVFDKPVPAAAGDAALADGELLAVDSSGDGSGDGGAESGEAGGLAGMMAPAAANAAMPAAANAAMPTAANAATPDAPAAAGVVVLEAREEVWVRIYEPSTQTVAMSGVMKAGDRFQVPAAPAGFRLWTGKAGALVLSIGGKPLPPLGGMGEVMRDVSLTPADLRARSQAGSAAGGAASAAAANSQNMETVE